MSITTIAGLIVGATFLIAGVAKAANPAWVSQARGLGVPLSLAQLVPWGEIAIGACAMGGLARRLALGGACVLLVAFSVVLVRSLRDGRRPPCACFGGRTPRPISWLSVGRNGVLVAVAVAGIVAST